MLSTHALLLLGTLQAAASTTGDKDVPDKAVEVMDYVTRYGWPLLTAIVVLVAGKFLAQFITSVIRKVMQKRKMDAMLTGFLSGIAYASMMVMVVITALGELGINTGSFVAVLGAATLAIGFALQGSLSNFAAGVMLIIFRPFKVGDFIEAGGATGVVEEVGIFATLMRTGDNKKIIIPNGGITDGNIVNYSAKETRRVDMVFGISYDDDLRAAKALLKQIVDEDERILKDPAPTIGVSELADSSVNFVCRPWVKSGDYWPVLFDIHEQVKLRFDAAGITIPYPQRDVHMHQVGNGAA